MINKQKTLKLIKAKVDEPMAKQIRLKKPITCVMVEGVGYKRKVERRLVKLVKDGNSVNYVDDTFFQRNINTLETKDLHKILWQILREREKAEIALEHLVSTKPYLEG